MSSFHAEIITHPDKEMLIYLRYLSARTLYLDWNANLHTIPDKKIVDRLRKAYCAAEKEALKEIVK